MKCKFSRLALTAILLMFAFVANSRVYLVAVGVGDYSAQRPNNDLQLSRKDAKAIVDIYSKNGAVDYVLLLDKDATRDKIVRAMRKVYRRAKKDDTIVFYFSGHGGAGDMLVFDQGVGYKKVIDAMAKSPCKNKMIFADTCHSGSMRGSSSGSQSPSSSVQNANVMLFLSSRGNETSNELPGDSNGLFTKFLCKGLAGNADADRNGTITAKELFIYVQNCVAEEANKYNKVHPKDPIIQHPVMWGKFSDNMPVMKW